MPHAVTTNQDESKFLKTQQRRKYGQHNAFHPTRAGCRGLRWRREEGDIRPIRGNCRSIAYANQGIHGGRCEGGRETLLLAR